MNYSAIVERFVRLDDALVKLLKAKAPLDITTSLAKHLTEADKEISKVFPDLNGAQSHLDWAEAMCNRARRMYGNIM